MAKFEQEKQTNITKKYLSLSTTVIATILLALSPKEQVVAQEKIIEDSTSEDKIKTFHSQYHSLLAEVEEDSEQEVSRELTVEQIEIIQEKLLALLEEQGDTELVEQLKEETLTFNELDNLFAELLGSTELEETEKLEEELAETDEVLEDEEIEELEEVLEEELVEPEEIPEAEEFDEPEKVTEEELEEETELDESEKALEDEIEAEDLVEEVDIDEPEEIEIESPKVEQKQPTSFSMNNSTPESLSYTVQAGDTLNKIAKNFHVSVNHLVNLNKISNRNLIRVGQRLIIHGNNPTGESGLEDLGKPLTNREFIEYLGTYASAAAQERNLYASVMIAQAALETGYGKSGLSSAPNHNLYGMKGRYNGESVVMRTREYSNSKGWYYVNAHFKKYPSYFESLLDHADYIRRGPSWGSNFYSGVWRENTSSYRDATSWLQGRYATDPAYANKLNQIIEDYNLTRFDSVVEDDSVVLPPEDTNDSEGPVKPSTGDKSQEDTETTTYTVKRGDTLSHIARAYKMSVRELKDLNSLNSDLILIGQTLKVKEDVTESKPTPAPSKPVNPSESNASTYTVKSGDTLSHIARAYKMSVRELKDLNSLNSDLILIGQTLKVKEDVTESKPTPAPSKPVNPSESNASTYTVKSGDTLSHIARAYKMSVRELKNLNSLKSDLILIGQRLQVKGSMVETQPTPAPSKPTPSTPSESNAATYTVKSGDTLSHIARTYIMSVRELKSLNNLKSDLILIGQTLKVKKGETESKPTPTPTPSKPVKPSESNATTYRVKRGDTLSHIARTYKTTVAQLKQVNQLQSDMIYVGQNLKINGSTNTNPSVTTQSYRIKAGDTLSHIARRFNTTVRELKAKNNLKSDLILVNQILKI